MPPIAACADPAQIVVSKTIVGDAFGGPGGKSGTFTDEDVIQFAISVANVGGETLSVTITDTFDPVFATPTWTRTGPTGTVTTGSGDISSTVSIAPTQRVTYLVDVVYTPTSCTSLTVNMVSVLLPGDNCCGEAERYDAVKVLNAEGPAAKLDPVEGWTAMEALFYLLEGMSLPGRVRFAAFINGCNDFGDLLNAGGGAGDGVAVAILDVFGDPTGLYAETSPGA